MTFSTETIIEVDEGVDNPFRPGDRLSKEAEIIVQLIKAGKPISPQSPTEEDIRTLEEWKKQQEILLHPEFDESQYIEDGQISPNGLSFNGNNNTTTKVNSPKANGNNNNNYKNNVKSPKGSPSKKKQNRKPSSPSSSPSTPSSPQSLGHHQASFDSQADSAFEKKKKVCCVIQ